MLNASHWSNPLNTTSTRWLTVRAEVNPPSSGQLLHPGIAAERPLTAGRARIAPGQVGVEHGVDVPPSGIGLAEGRDVRPFLRDAPGAATHARPRGDRGGRTARGSTRSRRTGPGSDRVPGHCPRRTRRWQHRVRRRWPWREPAWPAPRRVPHSSGVHGSRQGEEDRSAPAAQIEPALTSARRQGRDQPGGYRLEEVDARCVVLRRDRVEELRGSTFGLVAIIHTGRVSPIRFRD